MMKVGAVAALLLVVPWLKGLTLEAPREFLV